MYLLNEQIKEAGREGETDKPELVTAPGDGICSPGPTMLSESHSDTADLAFNVKEKHHRQNMGNRIFQSLVI